MAWMIEVQHVEEICEEIEKSLWACGLSMPISIVRTAFSRERKAHFVRPADITVSADLRPLVTDSITRNCRVDASK